MSNADLIDPGDSPSPAPSDAVSGDSETTTDYLGLHQARGNRYYDLYNSGNGLINLVKAVQCYREIIDVLDLFVSPEEEYDRSRKQVQDILVMLLTELYDAEGSKDVLREVATLSQALYESTAADEPTLSSRANNYANILAQRYRLEGDLDDLTKSIEFAELAVAASPDAVRILREPEGTITLQKPHQNIEALNTLASSLCERSLIAGSLEDLNRSIEIMGKLVAAVPHGASSGHRPGWLSNLAASLCRRYEQSDDGRDDGRHDDLSRAIHLSLEAVGDTTDSDPRRGVLLCGIAHPLAQLGVESGETDAVDEAIKLLAEAQRITADGHPRQIEIGANLAMNMFKRWQMADDSELLTDLYEAAVSLATFTLMLTPDDHPSRPHLHNILGLFQYGSRGRISDSDAGPHARNTLENLQLALNNPRYTPLYRRVQAGRMILGLCCEMGSWQTAYEAAVVAIGLSPKLTPRAFRNADRQRILSADDIIGFGADGAAAALMAGRDGFAALRLLEMGRGLLASSVLELRADLTALRMKHAPLAERFISLRDEIQTTSPRQQRASKEFDDLLDEIRGKPGFGGFLQPPSEEDILEAARDGPLVVLSASEVRGVDAILVESHRVRVLALGGLTVQDLERRAEGLGSLKSLTSPKLLQWLWDVIARPILDALGFTQPPPGTTLPRIWWIPTGILSRYPLHAAGYHSTPGATVIDRVMSSYSPSITSLLEIRRRAFSAPRPGESTALLVAMAKTRGFQDLAHATREAEEVEGLLSSGGFQCVSLNNKPCKAQVLQHLETCQVFHFAGHGKEDIIDPSQSALLLHDWQSDPMTVESILDVNLRGGSPFMAYLAACETGKVTRAKYRDESIHLISAYQLAGFRHVIGALREVDDLVSVTMATEMYRSMLQSAGGEALTDAAVCRGLHAAATTLRAAAENKRNVRGRRGREREDRAGERKIGACESSEDDDSEEDDLDEDSWIPYVHFGV